MSQSTKSAEFLGLNVGLDIDYSELHLHSSRQQLQKNFQVRNPNQDTIPSLHIISRSLTNRSTTASWATTIIINGYYSNFLFIIFSVNFGD
jgi:hypothetical protein